MALAVEFSRRFTVQLQKILTFYDERNGTDNYSPRNLSWLHYLETRYVNFHPSK